MGGSVLCVDEGAGIAGCCEVIGERPLTLTLSLEGRGDEVDSALDLTLSPEARGVEVTSALDPLSLPGRGQGEGNRVSVGP